MSKVCNECNVDNVDNAKFCRGCGKEAFSVSQDIAQENEGIRKKKSLIKRISIIIWGTLFFVLLITLILSGISGFIGEMVLFPYLMILSNMIGASLIPLLLVQVILFIIGEDRLNRQKSIANGLDIVESKILTVYKFCTSVYTSLFFLVLAISFYVYTR